MGSLNISTLPWTHPTIFSRYDYMGPRLFYLHQQSTLRHLKYIGSKSSWQVVYIYLYVYGTFWIPVLRIRITWWGSGSLFHLDADPDPTFHVDTDLNPDPAPHWSHSNLQPLVYSTDPPRLLCEWPRPPWLFWVSTAPVFDRIQLFTLMRIWIRIQLPKMMGIQIRICNAAEFNAK